MEERRDLAVLEPLDGELDHAVGAGRRGNRIAALGLIAVRRRQAHIDMLPGDEAQAGSASVSMKLLTRGVRGTIAAIVAVCQRSRAAGAWRLSHR